MIRAIALLLLVAGTAAADKPKILVLPLAPTRAIDAGAARTFDARLLVALDDTKRVQTLTHDEEPECTTLKCLADLGTEVGANYVLSLSVVREDANLTLFGTLVDTKSGTAWRRVELPRINPTALSRQAPAELVPQILGIASPVPVLGFGKPSQGVALTAMTDLSQRLATQRAFRVVQLDATDRSQLTHRADITISELTIETPRRLLCKWIDGTLVGTFTVTELASGKVVFTKPVRIEVSKREHFSSQAEVTQLLVDGAVAQWFGAVNAQNPLKQR